MRLQFLSHIVVVTGDASVLWQEKHAAEVARLKDEMHTVVTMEDKWKAEKARMDSTAREADRGACLSCAITRQGEGMTHDSESSISKLADSTCRPQSTEMHV